MKKLVFAILACLLYAPYAAAQTPCDATATTTVYGPASIYATLDDFTAVIDNTATPIWTEVVLGIFNAGVTPSGAGNGNAVSAVTIPRANITLVSGTCYKLGLTTLVTLPLNTQQFASARTRRTTPDAAESAWSGLSNPFVRPPAPATPRAVRFGL